jgi:subtilisin family serine protease
MHGILRHILVLIAALLLAPQPARAGGDGAPQQVLIEGPATERENIAEQLGLLGYPIVLVNEYPSFSTALYQFEPQLSKDEYAFALELLDALVGDDESLATAVNSEVSIERGGGQTGSLWVSGLSGAQFESQYGLGLTNSDFAADHATGQGVKIALIDSGLVPGAPHSSAFALAYGYDLVNGTGEKGAVPADEGDGQDQNQVNDADEGVGHGTFIASIIARVAPGARHLHIKVLDDEGECELSDIFAALEICIAENVHVVNLSIAPVGPTSILKSAFTACRQNGTIIVAAGGNSTTNENPFTGADADLIQVGASTHADALWNESATGPWVDILAPGATMYGPKGLPIAGQSVVGVIGTNPDGTPNFVAASGTSFAAAFVTGAAACYRAANPGWPDDAPFTPGEVAPGEIATRFLDAMNASGASVNGTALKRVDAGSLVAGFAAVPRCPGDIARASSGEGSQYRIDGVDLAALLIRFGETLTDPRRIDRANLETSTPERIDANDLAALLARWGIVPPVPCP